MLAVSPSSVATGPPVMPDLPRLRLYDMLGCSVGLELRCPTSSMNPSTSTLQDPQNLKV